ncbi:MAG TPA: AroM family protein [Vicinamibacterales bacterium]
MSRPPTIAAITIGQSPRPDLLDEIGSMVPAARWIERGALDALDDRAIAGLAPDRDDFPLVTKLRSGRTAVVGEQAIRSLLQDAVDEAGAGADLVLMLCSGPLDVRSRRPMLLPDRLLTATVSALMTGGPVAVLTPSAEQMTAQSARWRAAGVDPLLFPASPWGAADFAGIGAMARERGAALVVLDCFAYSAAMKETVAAASGLPTMRVRSLLGRVTAELLA